MFDEPIKTIEQAKQFYKANGCASYHIWHDYSEEKVNEYKQLHISRETENEWRKESFDEYYFAILEKTDCSKLFWLHNILQETDVCKFCWLHSLMYDLFDDLHTNEYLLKMLEVTQYIQDKVPGKYRVVIAENINGRVVRTVRRGLIYMAYDLKNIPAAKEFAELSLSLSNYIEGESLSLERCQKAAQLCNDISLELGLDNNLSGT
jgi:hypothetical protein